MIHLQYHPRYELFGHHPDMRKEEIILGQKKMSKTNDENVLYVTYCCIMEYNNPGIVADILFHATMHIPSTV
jgi:hypothetical protein